MTQEKMSKLLLEEPIELHLQEKIIQAFLRQYIINFPDAKIEIQNGIIHYYDVLNSNKKNISVTLFDGKLEIIYLEHYNCFLLYTKRVFAQICKENGLLDSNGTLIKTPLPHLFPDECFSRTSQGLIVSEAKVQRMTIKLFYKYHDELEPRKTQKIIDKCLDDKDFTELRLMYEPLHAEMTEQFFQTIKIGAFRSGETVNTPDGLLDGQIKSVYIKWIAMKVSPKSWKILYGTMNMSDEEIISSKRVLTDKSMIENLMLCSEKVLAMYNLIL